MLGMIGTPISYILGNRKASEKDDEINEDITLTYDVEFDCLLLRNDGEIAKKISINIKYSKVYELDVISGNGLLYQSILFHPITLLVDEMIVVHHKNNQKKYKFKNSQDAIKFSKYINCVNEYGKILQSAFEVIDKKFVNRITKSALKIAMVSEGYKSNNFNLSNMLSMAGGDGISIEYHTFFK